MIEALRLADLLETGAIWQDQEAAASELRRLHAELERKSDAIQRLWKERDELRALNAELVEALRSVIAWMDAPDESAFSDMQLAAARAALEKVEASK